MDEELLEPVLAYLPESLKAWLGLAIVVCAVATLFWPEPSESAHPFWRGLHALVKSLGRNFSREGRLAQSLKKTAQNVKKGKIALFRRRKG